MSSEVAGPSGAHAKVPHPQYPRVPLSEPRAPYTGPPVTFSECWDESPGCWAKVQGVCLFALCKPIILSSKALSGCAKFLNNTSKRAGIYSTLATSYIRTDQKAMNWVLVEALKNDDPVLVERALKGGANPNSGDYLPRVLDKGFPNACKIAKLLFQHGANVNQKYGICDSTLGVLLIRIDQNDPQKTLELLELFIKKGAALDGNKPGSLVKIALDRAMIDGVPEGYSAANILLQNGAPFTGLFRMKDSSSNSLELTIKHLSNDGAPKELLDTLRGRLSA